MALYEFKISDAHSAKIKELATKAAVVNVFGGKENKVLYVSNNEEVESAIQSIEKAYDSIVTYVYKSLLVSTRLDKYAKNIEVNMVLNDDNALTCAIIYRLIHHSHIISISGQSYRLRDKARLLN